MINFETDDSANVDRSVIVCDDAIDFVTKSSSNMSRKIESCGNSVREKAAVSGTSIDIPETRKLDASILLTVETQMALINSSKSDAFSGDLKR